MLLEYELDWIKIVDFLLIAKFLASPDNHAYPSIQSESSYDYTLMYTFTYVVLIFFFFFLLYFVLYMYLLFCCCIRIGTLPTTCIQSPGSCSCQSAVQPKHTILINFLSLFEASHVHRGWRIKFATGINVINQKIYEWSGWYFAKLMPPIGDHFDKRTASSLSYFLI